MFVNLARLPEGTRICLEAVCTERTLSKNRDYWKRKA